MYLELLRMKIQEEFEVPHQEKVARLETEVAKYREMFYNVRREHELLRTEYELWVARPSIQSVRQQPLGSLSRSLH